MGPDIIQSSVRNEFKLPTKKQNCLLQLFHSNFSIKMPSQSVLPHHLHSTLLCPAPKASFSSLMAMKLLLTLLSLLSVTFSIVTGDNSILGASWSADQSKEDSTEESQYISLPENPESYIALPESPENYITLPESEEATYSADDDDDNDDGSNFMLGKRPMTCNKYPPTCRKKSSPGPDCCKKKCTNIKKDPFNCGQCGRKCKSIETCCKGKCVNTSSDTGNCGKCGKKCKKWETCVYGMCSYA